MDHKTPFRTPAEIASKKKGGDPNVPVQGRIPESARDRLKAAADAQGKSLCWLITNVLLDYDAWLTSQKKPKKS